MGSGKEPPQVRVCEPVPVQDVFVTDVLSVENFGDHVRVTHVLERPDPECGGEIVRVIACRVVYSGSGFARAIRKVLGVLKCPHCGAGVQAGMKGDGNGDGFERHSGPLSS